jgi:hypothetical protein
MPVIPATWKAKAEGLQVQGQAEVSEILAQAVEHLLACAKPWIQFSVQKK